MSSTRRISREEAGLDRPDFLAKHRASLVVIGGGPEGMEHELDTPKVVLGRGPGADLTFADDAMSRTHASFEAGSDGFHVRDLGSTNGMRVNGESTQAYDLEHGDRLEIGAHVFQYVVEARQSTRTYVLPEN